MSRAFYPSDEYDSSELEREQARRRRPWLEPRGQDDGNEPPAAPRPEAPSLDAAEAV